GDSEIKPSDIKIGDFGLDIRSEENGVVLWIDNAALIEVARAAGSPKNKGAGILLNKKVGDIVKKDENIFTVYAEKNMKLERVSKILEEEKVFGIGDRRDMLIQEIKEIPEYKKAFIIER
ncbi:MAG TPA: thymidine phosphorylase, partial [archaeon]|nr:thymidine phosphorylase [archaeon]